jgi:serine/threonine protein phosphatase PrpC
MKNIKSISNTNSLRKSSKVKNKICQKIPHNNIKNMKLFPKTVIEYNQLNDDSILNSRSIKKSSSKILNNTKRKNNENEKVQNDEESGINTQLYNTNSFNNKDNFTNINSKIKQKNELENEIKSFGSYKNNFPQDDDVGENIDKKIENYKSISQKSTFGKNTSEFNQNMNNNEIKDSNTFSINNSKNNINKEKDINDINHDLNHYQNKNSSKSKKTNIIFKRSKPQSHIMNQTIMFKNYKENKEKNEINNDLESKINMVKIDKIENRLLNKKFEIKKKILNKSNSNDTMNVSEMSIDDKIMKINDFSDKIKKNFIPVENIKNTKELKDFNETKKIETLNNINNIKINDIITEKKNIPQDKDIKNINYISKIKKITKDKKKQKYTIEKNYFRNCKYKSLAGKDTLGNRKINQDLYLVQINFMDVEGFNLFGVLDGHGENGHKVAAFARDYIISQLASFFKSQNSINLTSIYSLLKKKNFSLIKDIYQQADKELEKQKFNSNFSGTTCVIVFQIAEKLICANVGDSRAILVTTEKSNSEIYKVIELSHDQKPDLPEEKKRIYKMGGIVDQMLDSKGKRNGPFRVWAGKENYPGLSMSRCIGDLKGKKCGLISEPQIIEYEIDEKSKYMVICSDGVWEFSNNEDVMRMGTEFYKEDNIDEFMDKIIKVSEFWWEKEDIMRDDITAVIVFF